MLVKYFGDNYLFYLAFLFLKCYFNNAYQMLLHLVCILSVNGSCALSMFQKPSGSLLGQMMANIILANIVNNQWIGVLFKSS